MKKSKVFLILSIVAFVLAIFQFLSGAFALVVNEMPDLELEFNEGSATKIFVMGGVLFVAGVVFVVLCVVAKSNERKLQIAEMERQRQAEEAKRQEEEKRKQEEERKRKYAEAQEKRRKSLWRKIITAVSNEDNPLGEGKPLFVRERGEKVRKFSYGGGIYNAHSILNVAWLDGERRCPICGKAFQEEIVDEQVYVAGYYVKQESGKYESDKLKIGYDAKTGNNTISIEYGKRGTFTSHEPYWTNSATYGICRCPDCGVIAKGLFAIPRPKRSGFDLLATVNLDYATLKIDDKYAFKFNFTKFTKKQMEALRDGDYVNIDNWDTNLK